MKNSNVKFSIITIVYNGENTILDTINSVINQTYSNIEYILIDGNSSDKTCLLISGFLDNIDIFISEKDFGIYDAMNKGLSYCSGDYVIFMNGGDSFTNKNILSDIFNEIINSPVNIDFLYGDAFITELNKSTYFKKARSHKYAWYGMFTNHQAMVYNLEIIRKYNINYDINYKISADYKFTLEFLEYSLYNFYFPKPICNFSLDGISNNQKQLGLKEAEKARIHILKYSKFRNFFIRQILYTSRFVNEHLSYIYKIIRYNN